MIRLLWKEAREQLWFVIAALTAPFVIAAYKVLLHDPRLWPQDHGDALLVYAVFVIWGARSIPAEREHGRLTLATIPVPRWGIWLAKIVPAFALSFVSAAIMWSIGTAQASGLTPDVVAATSVLCFSTAFLLGIALPAPTAALLTCFSTLLAVCAANAWISGSASDLAPSKYPARWDHVVLAEIMLLLLAGLVAIAWRGAMASPRKARLPVVLGILALIVPSAWTVMAPSRHDSDTDSWFAGGPLVSRSAGWVAFLDGFPHGWPHRKRNPIYRDTGLWVMRLDGSDRRLVSDRLMPEPVVWLGTGELLYIERDDFRNTDRYLAWNPKTARSRFVRVEPTGKTVNQPWVSPAEGWEASWVAAEPHGTRFACFHKSQSYLRNSALDLWLVDTATGKATLLAPWLDATAVYWRAGRIYVVRGDGADSISPSGGALREETRLPGPDKEASR